MELINCFVKQQKRTGRKKRKRRRKANSEVDVEIETENNIESKDKAASNG